MYLGVNHSNHQPSFSIKRLLQLHTSAHKLFHLIVHNCHVCVLCLVWVLVEKCVIPSSHCCLHRQLCDDEGVSPQIQYFVRIGGLSLAKIWEPISCKDSTLKTYNIPGNKYNEYIKPCITRLLKVNSILYISLPSDNSQWKSLIPRKVKVLNLYMNAVVAIYQYLVASAHFMLSVHQGRHFVAANKTCETTAMS